MRKFLFLVSAVLPELFRFFFVKLLLFFGVGKKYKNIWLISERGTDARDNGYFFFRYLKSEHPEISCYYVIEKKSPDYEKVAALGEVVHRRSFQHYLAFFGASHLISTHIMGFSPNASVYMILQKKNTCKLKGKQIFLQHGITKDDIEGLKYPNVRLDLFVCGAKPEYEYIRDTYRHPDGVVKLTGLARYDTLANEERLQILCMPTWRMWLNSLSAEEFADSDYFHAYHSFLKRKDLHDWLRSKRMRLLFYPHYEFQRYISLFSDIACDCIEICDFETHDVQTLLKEATLLITDYSSVCFDVAYLKKPILFYQFDQEKFFGNHYKKGYFDEKEFGAVVYEENKLLSLLQSLWDGNSFSNPYISSQEAFFAGVEKGCCDRIYCAIRELEL